MAYCTVLIWMVFTCWITCDGRGTLGVDRCDKRKCNPKYCVPLQKCDFEACQREGCGRVPATPAPSTPLTPTEPTINGSVRNVECTSGEVNRTACLNGGTCFAMELNSGERVAACHCPEYYKGQRCQEFYVPIFPSQDDPVSRAGIAASIAVLIIIVVVFIVVAILYYRRKQRVERSFKNANGTLLNNGNGDHLPESHIPPRNMNPSVYSTNGKGICRNKEEGQLLFSDYRNELLISEYKVTSV
ncbi:pro-neuregulin-1, membrane-bound isoform-like isoform X2 [Dreissena polymorpha]|uniref:pro-neuregulin-1, membrane-bound isoform-like isoform X2 n=1 Tax=Dreissena polymorpha TaxID=45954 RepID=UPI002264F3CF|nr:pro-neuregulin-1, membrane-bound isoform-like isoform X2 [Dreissena polymorpha]